MWHISEEGNTLELENKKTTAVGSASYCFLVLIFMLILSLRKLRGFLLYGFLEEKLFVSLVSCDVLMFY